MDIWRIFFFHKLNNYFLADKHRQRIINWMDSTGGLCAAFDFTTKGILQVRNRKLFYSFFGVNVYRLV
jgi:hypothetical protein